MTIILAVIGFAILVRMGFVIESTTYKIQGGMS